MFKVISVILAQLVFHKIQIHLVNGFKISINFYNEKD